MLPSFRLWCVLCVCCVLVASCSPSGPTKTDDPKDQGEYALKSSINPDPPKVGQHTMVLTLTDKAGKMVPKAKLTVYPHMPHHGHGSTEDPKVEDMGDGTYKATPITFQMPGYWEIRVTVEIEGKKEVKNLIVNVQ